MRETATLEEGKKSHIGSEGVPLGIDWKENEMHVSCFVGALEALQGRIPLAESGVHKGHCIGRNIALARDGFERI
jgi:hypothetical protein